MKTFIVALTILVIAAGVERTILINDKAGSTREVRGIEFDNKQKWDWPRSQQSCSDPVDNSEIFDGITNVLGWYWNDQQCQPCAHPYCTCTEYRSCDSCIDGYAKIDASSPLNPKTDTRLNTCYECPNLETSGYMNQFPYGGNKFTKPENDHFKSGDEYGTNGQFEVTSCEIFYNTDLDHKFFDERYAGEGYNYLQWIKGFRANSCNAGDAEKGVKVVQYGSICWYITGCSSYNKWGRCNTCFDGYYLNEYQYCEQCKTTCDTEYSDGMILNRSNCRNAGGCNRCSNENSCDECKSGYWKAGPIYFDRIPGNSNINRGENLKETLLDFNACVKCPVGCSCELLTDFSNFNRDSFILTPMEGYYKKGNTCAKCDVITGCRLCTSNPDSSTPTCNQCEIKTSDQQPQFYLPEPVGGTKCLRCPDNCYECEKVDDNTTSCRPNKCFNGFRPQLKTVVGTTQITECVPCELANASRCTTIQDQEIITQCNTGATSNNKNYDTEDFNGYGRNPVPRMNFNPPNSNDFLRIRNSEGSIHFKCVQNEKLCKVMNLDQQCTECYTEQGYYLSQGICKKCAITNCKQCEPDASCGLCEDGYELIRNSTNQNTCKKCTATIDNCATCSYGGLQFQCEECQPGYVLQEDNTCKPCIIQNCADCRENINSCATCKERFVLWDEAIQNNATLATEQRNLVCETCEPGCLTCETRKICTKCQGNLYLHGGVCHDRLANCVEFDGSSEGSHICKWCKYGYRLTGDGVCVRCFSPDLGATHCHTECEGDDCWYSTVNDLNLIQEENQETTE